MDKHTRRQKNSRGIMTSGYGSLTAAKIVISLVSVNLFEDTILLLG